MGKALGTTFVILLVFLGIAITKIFVDVARAQRVRQELKIDEANVERRPVTRIMGRLTQLGLFKVEDANVTCYVYKDVSGRVAMHCLEGGK